MTKVNIQDEEDISGNGSSKDVEIEIEVICVNSHRCGSGEGEIMIFFSSDQKKDVCRGINSAGLTGGVEEVQTQEFGFDVVGNREW